MLRPGKTSVLEKETIAVTGPIIDWTVENPTVEDIANPPVRRELRRRSFLPLAGKR